MSKNITTKRQIMLFVALASLGISLAMSPNDLLTFTSQSTWIPIILTAIVNIFICYFYYKLSLLMANHDSFFDFLEAHINIYFLTFIKFIYLAFFIFTSALCLRILCNFVSVELLPETPFYALIFPMSLAVLYSAHLGIRNLLRSCEVLFWITFALFTFATSMLIKKFEPSNLLPLIECSPNDILRSTIILVSYTSLAVSPIIFFNRLFNLKEKKNTHGLIWGVLIGTLMNAVVIIFLILILPPKISNLYYYPGYILAKEVSFGKIIERSEAFIVTLWFFAVFVKSSFYFSSAKKTIFSTFKSLKNRYTLTLFSVYIIIFTISISRKFTLFTSYHFFKDYWFYVSFLFGLIIPGAFYIYIRLKINNKKDS